MMIPNLSLLLIESKWKSLNLIYFFIIDQEFNVFSITEVTTEEYKEREHQLIYMWILNDKFFFIELLKIEKRPLNFT